MRGLFLLLVTLPVFGFSQITVDDVGDGWKAKVDSAITLISKVSPSAKEMLDSNTTHIEFWLGDRSSTRPDPNRCRGTILLAVDEIPLGVVNIAAVLVHESFHLYLYNHGQNINAKDEERWAYVWELMFLQMVPNCPRWLIQNANYQIQALGNQK